MTFSKRKPDWFRRRFQPVGQSAAVRTALRGLGLHTVCTEAKCPNQSECFSRGTATFLLLGPNCTRNCTFCAVNTLPVHAPDPSEPIRTGQATAQMGLDFYVVTMVSRDDLPDGGSYHVVRTVDAIRQKCPEAGLELLISDLAGNWDALEMILVSSPEVLSHNLETCSRLYEQVRPQANYQRSLQLLKRASNHRPRLVTKSGLMLGLGETREEVLQVMDDLREAGSQVLTMGQYLAPSASSHPVVRYVEPDEFKELKGEALSRGFIGVASGPLVRSSFRAGELYRDAVSRASRPGSQLSIFREKNEQGLLPPPRPPSS